MIDREFTKLNTSIQTASNSSELKRDEEGNIEATIALRLPDNLFTAKSGPKKVDSVTMQTSKMRLSLENTPIAEIPMDMELTTPDLKATKCQLDVYPFCLLDNGQIKPESLDKTVFPYYKDHTITFIFYRVTNINVLQLIYAREIKAHSKYLDDLSEDPFYELLDKSGALKGVTHILNLCAQSNHELYKVEGDMLLVKNTGTLEQMLQDGIENAITYASTSINTTVNVYICAASTSLPDDKAYRPDTSYTYVINGVNYYFCKWELAPDDITRTPPPNTVINSLNHACKPDINLREQSLGIAYDSVAFKDRIPVVWNTPYIETFDHPEQMMIDPVGKDEWQQPPPKRLYREDPEIDTTTTVYSYTVNPTLSQGYVMNIIANEEMRRTFSFLPWIPCTIPLTKTYYKIPCRCVTQRNLTNVESGALLTFRAGVTIQMQKYAGFGHTVYGVSQRCLRYEYWVRPENYASAETNATLRYNQGVRMDLDSTTPHPETLVPGYPPESSKLYIKETTLNRTSEYEMSTSEGRVSTTTLYLPTDIPITSASRDTTLYTEVPDMEYRARYQSLGNYRNVKYWYDRTQNSWVLGKIPQGNWDSTVPIYDRWIPPFEPDVKEERIYNAGTSSEYKKVQYYYILTPNEEPFATYGEAFIYYNPESSSQTTSIFNTPYQGVWNNGIVERYMHEEIPSAVYADLASYIVTIPDPDLIPNLDLNETNQFYILDGTTAEVDVGANEIIDNRRRFLRKVVDRQTGYRGSSAQLTLVNVALFNKASDGKWYIRYGMHKDKLYKDDVSPELLPEHFFWSYKIRVAHDDPYMPTSTEDLSSDHVLGEGIDYSAWMHLGAVYREQETYDILEVLTPLEVIQRMEYTGGIPYDHQDEIESEILYDLPLSECGSHLDMLREDVRTFHDDEEITKSGENNYQYILWFFIADPDNAGGYFQPTPGRRRQFPDIVTGEVGPSFFNAIPKTTLPASWFDKRETEQGGETDLLYFRIPIPSPIYKPPYLFRDESYYPLGVLSATIDVDVTQTRTTTIEPYPEEGVPQYEGNKRLTFTWNNLPMVVMSPIQSIVLTLQGMDVNQEYQPINASDFTGSALTSSIPVIENFYSLAQSLRDLHDELVIVKDSYSDTATYTLATTSGQERSITLSAKYITKDGKLHQIYIPPKGVFSLQLTFGISYYFAG